MKSIRLVLFGIVALSLSVEPLCKEVFDSNDLGFAFTYGDDVSLDFNPHSMRKIQIHFKGEHVGGLVVSVVPNNLKVQQYLDYGVEYYNKKYRGITIDVSEHKNQNDIGYHRYRVEAKPEYGVYSEDRFIFIKKRPGIYSDDGIMMTYTFNFYYIKSEIEEKKKNLFQLVDTFIYIKGSPDVNEVINMEFNNKSGS